MGLVMAVAMDLLLKYHYIMLQSDLQENIS